MKRFVTILLAVVLLANMGLISYADEITNVGGNEVFTISGKYIPGDKPSTVYSVNVSWPDMNFKYDVIDARTWIPETHSYSGRCQLKPSAGESAHRSVTVKNNSNSAVDVTVDLQEATPPISGIKLVLNNSNSISSKTTLSDASKGEYGTEETFDVYVLPDSNEETNPDQFSAGKTVTVGTVTITVTIQKD